MKTRRKLYPGLAGKVVERAESFEDDGQIFIVVRFADNTQLTFVLAPQPPKIKTAELLRWKRGDSSVVRAYTP
jgi:hypothetical protein